MNNESSNIFENGGLIMPINSTDEFVCNNCGQLWKKDFSIGVSDGRIICINCFKQIVDRQKTFYNRIDASMLFSFFIFIFCLALCLFLKIKISLPACIATIWLSTCPVSFFTMANGNDGNISVTANSPLMAFIIAPIVFVMSFNAQKKRKKMIDQNDKVLFNFKKKFQTPNLNG